MKAHLVILEAPGDLLQLVSPEPNESPAAAIRRLMNAASLVASALEAKCASVCALDGVTALGLAAVGEDARRLVGAIARFDALPSVSAKAVRS